MPDVREVLHQAAAPPTRLLDVSALQRAARRRRSRFVAWLASLGALVALGSPVGVQWASSGGRDTVRTLPGRVSTTTTTTSTTVAALVPNEADVSAAGSDASSTVLAGPDERQGGQTSAIASDDAAYPLSPSCSVNNSGAAPDELRMCRFTATTAGGWGGGYSTGVPGPVGGFALDDASSRVVVTRNGVSTEYRTSPKNGVGCASNVIEPGDLVEVDLRAAGESTGPPAPYQAGAGSGWGC